MTPQIPVPCLGLVTDRGLCASDSEELVRRVAQAVRGGVNLVQLREKGLPGGQLLRLAEDLRNVTSGRALLFINERVDVAIACGADGVQLGEEGLPVEAARLIDKRHERAEPGWPAYRPLSAQPGGCAGRPKPGGRLPGGGHHIPHRLPPRGRALRASTHCRHCKER